MECTEKLGGDNINASIMDDIEFLDEDSFSSQDEREEYPYEVVSPEEVLQLMMNSIQEVNSIIELPQTTIIVLLNYFKWDKEKLIERFFDGDEEQLYAEANIANPYRKSVDKLPHRVSDTEECEICLISFPLTMVSGLVECNHRFCTSCWAEYLTIKIVEEGLSLTISCAAHDCDTLIDEPTVMGLVKSPSVRSKYQQNIVNTFVQCNKLLRWCPGPDCNNAISIRTRDSQQVTCTCLHTFCFLCGENWHDPVTCSLLKKWIQKWEDYGWNTPEDMKVQDRDRKSVKWIKIHTKECPNCKINIEKIGGCNYMRCRNPSCGALFCWVCLVLVALPERRNVTQERAIAFLDRRMRRLFEEHPKHSCNRYMEQATDAIQETEETSDVVSLRECEKEKRMTKKKKKHIRFTFYCKRYVNHLQSLKLESELHESVQRNMEEMQLLNMSWMEAQFLKKAVHVLCQCRQTLQHTYIFAYYLKQNNQSMIFEQNQEDLERSTETLSQYLEHDMGSMDLPAIKQKIQDMYKYCESRRKKLLEHVQEGYENDWWIYRKS